MKIHGMIISAIIVLLSGCAQQAPDFIGYVFAKDKENNKTIVVEATDGDTPKVLIRKGVSRLVVGSKVEVFYRGNGVDDVFPSNGPATLREISTGNGENTVLRALFDDLYRKHGRNFYPAIAEVLEEPEQWRVRAMELSMEPAGDSRRRATYTIDKTNLGIATEYESES